MSPGARSQGSGAESPLSHAAGAAPFVFVVGKGGVGKTTAAGALALEWADAGIATHLISTDPAHSLADLFGATVPAEPAPAPCADALLLEQFDAASFAAAWAQRAHEPLTRLVDAGTYLDAEDVAGFTRLALPGVDEMMAVLRLANLAAAGRRVVVDTAPTGHTLRLLDAAGIHDGLARALRAMADKARVVASTMARRTVHLAAEALIDEMEAEADAFRTRVLAAACFVVITRPDAVVAAETERLLAALAQRKLRVAAVVTSMVDPVTRPPTLPSGNAAVAALEVPVLAEATGCPGLRHWRSAVRVAPAPGATTAASGGATDGATGAAPHRSTGASDSVPPDRPRSDPVLPPAAADQGPARYAPALPESPARPERPALPWLVSRAPRLLLFAGKGGTGKSTCAAAAAMALARSRDVLLCSTDPAGSLDDVFADNLNAVSRATPRLRVMQVDARAHMDHLRDEFRASARDALERVGLSESATLDRHVLESLWDMAPPGIDEFAALGAILHAADSAETIVLDPAPTGHFLRLLTLPDVALDWTRQLMRLIVKYHAAGAAGGAAESLLATARSLRGLRDLLHDPERCGVIAVTLQEPMVQAETARLVAALHEAQVAVQAVLYNRVVPGRVVPRFGVAGTPLRGLAGTKLMDVAGEMLPALVAPLVTPPPVGVARLDAFITSWKRVE